MVLSDTVSTNLRKGVLEYCVLALIGNGELYGLDIANGVSRAGACSPAKERCTRCWPGCVATDSWKHVGANPAKAHRGATTP